MTGDRASALPAALIAAYRAAHYCLLAPRPLTLRIDQPEPALKPLLQTYGTDRAVIVTAANPGSEPYPPDENARRLGELRHRVAAQGLAALPARGEAPDGSWPGEDSLLVPGADRPLGHILAAAFGQNAFVMIDTDAIPRLILLR